MGSFIDLTGQKFARLTVVRRVNNNKRGKPQWLCECDCGNEKIVSSLDLRRGGVRSCGCLLKEVISQQRPEKDLTGYRFGRLVVQEYKGGSKWLCLCDCKEYVVTATLSLNNGKTKSCGCWKKDVIKVIKKTHGLSKSRIYRIYHAMIYRCHNEKTRAFKNYGGRGITVCDEWLNNFEIFAQWAYSHGYSDELTIDRIDVNGNYNSDNCRWVKLEEQCDNKRNTRYISYMGNKYTLKELSHLLGIPRNTLAGRLRSGWTDDEIILPNNSRRKATKLNNRGRVIS